MLSIVKESINNKNYFGKGFKRIGRTRTIFYGIFLVLITTVFLTPIVSYKAFTQYIDVKKQVLNIPPNLVISYSGKSGLNTNTAYPIIIEAENNTFLVLDAKSNYKPSDKNTTEFVFKNRGYVVYTNGEIVDQQKYKMSIDEEVTLELGQVQKALNDLVDVYVFVFLLGIVSTSLLIQITLSVVITSLIFGTISYAVQEKKGRFLTYNQSLKKIVFLLPFYLLGLTINTILGNPIPGLGILLIMVAYLYFDKQVKHK